MQDDQQLGDLADEQKPEDLKEVQRQKPKDGRLEILRCVQNNFFCDITFQSIGLILLGDAVRTNPKLNDVNIYNTEIKVDAIKVEELSKYAVKLYYVYAEDIDQLISNYDCLVASVGATLETVITDLAAAGEKIVLGSLRLPVRLIDDGMLEFNLLCTTVKEGK